MNYKYRRIFLIFLLLISIQIDINTASMKLSEAIYKDCGITKICYGAPEDCEFNNNCNFMTTVSQSNGTFIFEMESAIENVAYVAVGLSYDMSMIDDSIIECVFENDVISSYTSWTVATAAGRNVNRMGISQDIIKHIEGSHTDGILYCKIERDPITIVQGFIFDLFNQSYHLLVATGSSLRENGLEYHGTNKIVSLVPINFTDIISNIPSVRRSLLIELHAYFMIVAWICTAPIGMILARYFKKTWVGSQLAGKDQWFAWHTILMSLTWLLHMTAFIMIFINTMGWAQVGNVHAILGVCSTIFCFFQPIGGFLRPSPTEAHRKYFNRGHLFGGTVSHAFAIVTMYFAVALPTAQLPETFYWLLNGFLVAYVIAHISFSITNYISMRKYVTSRKNGNQNKDDNYSVFRKILLTIYVAVVIGLTSTLISLVVPK